MASDGGYGAKNGASTAPVHRVSTEGVHLGDDFPQLCETCLGQNPYVRMVKLPFGDKICKISSVPYQAFRWKAGPNGRYKETIISFTVAAERNICQTCLNDMKFNLPIGMRDRLLEGRKEENVVNTIALPQSDVGLQYYYQQQQQLINAGIQYDNTPNSSIANDIHNLPATRQLQQFSHAIRSAESNSKTAFRNLPKLCSFWLNGACNRVLKKTCPFRPCCGPTSYAFPEIAGSHRDVCKELVNQLSQHGPAYVMKNMDNDTRQILAKSLKGGNRDEAIRKRVTGDDDLTQRYMNRLKGMNTHLDPPDDPSNVTLWLGNIDEQVTEQDIRDQMYAYGVITNIFISRSGKCAFVSYANREMAENAARNLFNNLFLRGQPINISWSKPRASAASLSSGENYNSSDPLGSMVMLAPPGMEKAPLSAYSLTGDQPINIPPPPPGLPPLNASAQPKSVTTTSTESNSIVSDSGVASSGPATINEPDTNAHKRSRHEDLSTGEYGRLNPKVLRPLEYPSMNPTRLGASSM